MYSNGLEGGLRLTIGQLAIAVSMRSAAAYEAQSVLKMNRMTAGSNLLSRAAECMGNIADGKGDWPTMKAFLIDTLGVTVTLPDSVQSYTDRMAAIAAVKAKVDALDSMGQKKRAAKDAKSEDAARAARMAAMLGTPAPAADAGKARSPSAPQTEAPAAPSAPAPAAPATPAAASEGRAASPLAAETPAVG